MSVTDALEPPPAVQPDVDVDADELRTRLLDAAARVFADKGYAGTKIKDIVRAAGLSSGALYGRFDSREQLLTEAVVAQVERSMSALSVETGDIADVIAAGVAENTGPLTDSEALRVELYVTARRMPEVASALSEARMRQRHAVTPLVHRARRDGSVVAGADTESILYFLETVGLGLLLQRSAGFSPPDTESWRRFVDTLVRDVFTHPADG